MRIIFPLLFFFSSCHYHDGSFHKPSNSENQRFLDCLNESLIGSEKIKTDEKCFALYRKNFLKNKKDLIVVENFLLAFEKFKFGNKDFINEMGNIYDDFSHQDFLNSKQLKSYSDKNVIILFKIFGFFSFYIGTPELAFKMYEVFLELEKRKKLTIIEYSKMLNAFEKAKMFSFSEYFYNKHKDDSDPNLNFPQIGHLPNTYYDYDYKRNALSPKILKTKNKDWIIGIVSPTCHFSINALEIISKHRTLGKLFGKKGIILYPYKNVTELELLKNWNDQHPKLKIFVVLSTENWFKEIIWTSYPTFYSIKDGRISLVENLLSP